MIRIFLSSPMKGKTDDEIKEIRGRAEKAVRERYKGQEVEILDTYRKAEFNDSTVKNKPLYFLGGAIQKLSEADIAVFCEGWKDARGCRIEEACAISYGIPIIYM